MSFTLTWPLWVRASEGSIRPIVVVNVMSVPFCTGGPSPVRAVVPLPAPDDGGWPFSIAVAMIVTSLLSDTDVVAANSVMTVPVGASSGILLHAARRPSGRVRSASRAERCVTISGANDNSLMSLRGQGSPSPRRGFGGTGGYARGAVLVALGVGGVVRAVVRPARRPARRGEAETGRVSGRA